MLEVHSTRLFPKNLGADRYHITGIASCCDWVVLTDPKNPNIHLHQRVPTDCPKYIFLSLRSPFLAITHFANRILPQLSTAFVLISGSEDVTLPNQTDARWRQFSRTEQAAIAAILKSPLLIHWFAENLDDATYRKMSPLPVGMVFSDGDKIRESIDVPEVVPTASRTKKVLCAHRIRTGPQWDPRKQVSQLASSVWSDFCTVIDREVTEAEYLDLIKEHTFVLCVEGGGLDPSPKAWQAILHGAIPIIRKSALASAYTQLPVAFVNSWEPHELTSERLTAWSQQLSPYHDTPALRRQVLDRLGLDYWWKQIKEASSTMATYKP